MYPVQAKPIIRPHIAPYFDDRMFFTTHMVPDDSAPPFVDPKTGKPILIPREVLLGEAEDPNHPQWFRGPVPCHDWCSLFSGFSMTACLRSCG
jgi:hypothetical protein